MQRHVIHAVDDLLELDESQLQRLIPDLIAWHKVAREVKALGATEIGFTWVDDGDARILGAKVTVVGDE